MSSPHYTFPKTGRPKSHTMGGALSLCIYRPMYKQVVLQTYTIAKALDQIAP